jgi:hypothetical protein
MFSVILVYGPDMYVCLACRMETLKPIVVFCQRTGKFTWLGVFSWMMFLDVLRDRTLETL